MKMKLKPWQIGLIATAGVVVLGGAGTGIYFGVNRSIDDKVKEQVDAAMESVSSSEAALDESETPTQAAGETTTESTTAAQPSKEPETVLVYVTPTETEKPDAPATPDPQPEPEPEPEPEIKLVYDAQLTKEVAELLSEKYSTVHRYTPMTDNSVIELTEFFENQFNSSADFSFKNGSTSFFFSHQYDNPTAEDIVSDWSSIIKTGDGIVVWRAAGNWIFAALEFR